MGIDAGTGQVDTSERTARPPWLAVCRDVVIAASLLAFVAVFIAQPFRVDGTSMEPALHDGERLIVSKLSYRLGDVERFDVVIARRADGTSLVKRVVGLPGEQVSLANGVLRVNGVAVPEPHLTAQQRSDENQRFRRLGDDEYLVLGDNRPVSLDSRRFGPLPRGSVRGRAVFRYWPPRSFGALPRGPASASFAP